MCTRRQLNLRRRWLRSTGASCPTGHDWVYPAFQPTFRPAVPGFFLYEFARAFSAEVREDDGPRASWDYEGVWPEPKIVITAVLLCPGRVAPVLRPITGAVGGVYCAAVSASAPPC